MKAKFFELLKHYNNDVENLLFELENMYHNGDYIEGSEDTPDTPQEYTIIEMQYFIAKSTSIIKGWEDNKNRTFIDNLKI